MEPENPLPCLHDPATCPYPELQQSSTRPTSYLLKIHFNNTLPSTPRFPKFPVSGFPTKTPYATSCFLYVLHASPIFILTPDYLCIGEYLIVALNFTEGCVGLALGFRSLQPSCLHLQTNNILVHNPAQSTVCISIAYKINPFKLYKRHFQCCVIKALLLVCNI